MVTNPLSSKLLEVATRTLGMYCLPFVAKNKPNCFGDVLHCGYIPVGKLGRNTSEEWKEWDEHLTACWTSLGAVTLSNEQSVSVFLSLFVCTPVHCHMPHITKSYCIHLHSTVYDLQRLGFHTPLMLTSTEYVLFSPASKCWFGS